MSELDVTQNQTLNELYARKSVRAFLDKPIPPQVKRAILEAAVQAPTAGCQQLYTILDITDPELKQRLAVTCDDQPFIAAAPLVLVFCADCKVWVDAYREGGCQPRPAGVGDLMLAVSDTNIAAQNAVTAAWALGVGSCYIGDVMEQYEAHRQLLGLPEHVFPAAMLVFGYPTDQQLARPKPARFALEDVVCENHYRTKTGPQLRAMFEQRRGLLSYEDWMARFCSRKYNSGFSREMTRSTAEYLKQFAPFCEE